MARLLLPQIPATSLPASTPAHRAPLPPRSSATPQSPSFPSSVLIIGGGLAGLAAASHLHAANLPFLLLESSDGLGGRVRTDSVDGFLLDRGFQILLTAYPEARRLLHFPSLNLRPFYPGALVFHSGRLHRVADPFRRPIDSLLSLPNPIGSIPDKLIVAIHRLRAPPAPSPETTISRRLRALGLSPSIIDRFFRPFLAGIFFDPELSASSRLFDFIFQCLAAGDNALPALGIGSIPAQLAANLPSSSISLHSKVLSIVPGNPPEIKLAGGEILAANLGVIVAVEQPEAEHLLPHLKATSRGPARSTVCIYFAAERIPVSEPILILNGTGEGIVNNMCFPTNVSASLGPEGGPALVSVSVVGGGGGGGGGGPERSDEELAAEVLLELGGWFGPEEVRSWKLLRAYRIEFAQPDQSPPAELTGKDPRIGERIYICGDHWSSATFDGALVSGRRAAEALMKDLIPAGS